MKIKITEKQIIKYALYCTLGGVMLGISLIFLAIIWNAPLLFKIPLIPFLGGIIVLAANLFVKLIKDIIG